MTTLAELAQDLVTDRNRELFTAQLRIAGLEVELQAARELIAELSKRPSMEQWRQLMASAAHTPAPAAVPPPAAKPLIPARALRFSR